MEPSHGYDNVTREYKITLNPVLKGIFDEIHLSENLSDIDFNKKQAVYCNLSLLQETLQNTSNINIHFKIYIKDEYKKVIKITNFSKLRHVVNIYSQFRNRILISDDFYFTALTIENVELVNDSRINAKKLDVRNSFIHKNVTIKSSFAYLRNSSILCNIKKIKTTHFFTNSSDVQINKNELIDSNNVLNNPYYSNIWVTNNVTINYKSPCKVLSFNVKGNSSYVNSDIQINRLNITVEKYPMIYLNVDNFPKFADFYVHKLFIYDKTEFSRDTCLRLCYRTEIYSENKRLVQFKSFILYDTGSLKSSELILKTDVFNVSSKDSYIKCDINATCLSVDSICLTNINEVKGVKYIDIHYSFLKIGYLHINKLLIEDKLHIRFYNLEESDQFYNDDDWDDFMIDFICIDYFDVDLNNISSEFISPHWDFNGSTRLFESEIYSRNNMTCISIKRRNNNPNEPDESNVNHLKTIHIILIVFGSISMLLICISLIFYFIKIKRSKIKKFISEDLISTTSLVSL
ncbi:hypothetical protein TVAG_281020 [Trichomonas vaginalis G3]|uniref:Surface antigen BspA-like n=1 Tax=Trichomonas vaginalis (strain ATCC PRA-98 / G3) TaxID=412133 RepID=A2DRM2_TRIV3|nr:hypothetical protein TVAGG3_0696710 [Trichomonas vaginalis G3]EAY16985.1 hypothetical protein TVAG_281020 [Trichomonas vaginalis G3]KAI5508969.1 hypothetical protein TVAGG3_0696710 [Trichomonas vaginalis G3]|eukprot:XP_001329208.1 hypothetical protein [Trichomonas vaginalis G3]